MHPFQRSMILLASLLALAFPLHADPDAEAEAEQTLRARFKLDGYTMRYLDEKGQAVGAEAFLKAMAVNKNVGVVKIPQQKTAEFRLLSAEDLKRAEARPDPFKLKPGEALPELRGKRLDGTEASALTRDGRYTLLNFFFAECAPCIAEVPALNTLAERHPELHVLGITFDPINTTRKFVQQRAVQFDTLSEARAGIDRLGVTSYPMLVLLDPEGRLLVRRSGGRASSGETDSLFRELEAWLKAGMKH